MPVAKQVTVGGNAQLLGGRDIRIGDAAPDFSVVDNDLKESRLADWAGRVLLISAVPSLDTSVCDLETRRFNAEAAGLGPDVSILTISMDLPFAQKRWCGAAGADRVVTLSDHRAASFGEAYGVIIPQMRLLARCLFVVDRSGTVRYIQLVPEVSHEPDYAAALAAVKAVL